MPAGAPDLVVGSGSLRVSPDGRTAQVSVINAGTLPSAATRARLTETPPLAASRGDQATFPHHHFLRGERGLVIWPESHADRLLLRVRWQGRSAWDTFAGKIRLETDTRAPLRPGKPRLTGSLKRQAIHLDDEEGWIAWRAATGKQAAGFDVSYDPAGRPSFLAPRELNISGALNLRQIFLGNWWLIRYLPSSATGVAPTLAEGQPNPASIWENLAISLQDVRLAHAWIPASSHTVRLEQPLPALDPRQQATLSFPLPRSLAQWSVQIDPDDRVREIHEGNNTATWRSSPGPIMVSLHTHASLSEGNASIDAQMDLLTRSGYEAVFWTDHDWRISGYHFPEELGFEDEPNSSWALRQHRLDGSLAAGARVTDERSTEGKRSLSFTADRPGSGGKKPLVATYALLASRARHTRSLAQELTIAFDLYPDLDHPLDSEFLLDLELSDQPHVRRHLSYRIQALPGALAQGQVVLPPPPSPAEPSLAAIPPGRWTRLVIPVSTHARRLFPEGVDNNISGLFPGLSVRRGRARWDMDRLTMEAGLTGAPLLDWEREWVSAYPGITSYVTTELSYYVPHFNPFVSDPFLPDYATLSEEAFPQRVREEVRERQGAFSLNHPLGVSPSYPDWLIESQLQKRLYGADLLEAGYRMRGNADLRAHLAFWDRALGNGIVASGIGVTDAHGIGRGNGFERDENNFATWVEAAPDSLDSLIDGLLAGRVTFGDPLLHRGRLSLIVDGHYRPGDVILGPAVARQAAFSGEALPPSSQLDLIVDGQRVASAAAGADGNIKGTFSLPAATRFVRLESWDARGEPVAFSNAVIFLGAPPPEGLPAARLRATVRDARLEGTGRFRVHTFETSSQGFRVTGGDGTGSLTLSGIRPAPASARAVGTGEPVSWSYDNSAGLLSLPLSGSGLEVRWPSGARRRWWIAGGLAAVALCIIVLLRLGARRRRRVRGR